jgi:hypothetical protein
VSIFTSSVLPNCEPSIKKGVHRQRERVQPGFGILIALEVALEFIFPSPAFRLLLGSGDGSIDIAPLSPRIPLEKDSDKVLVWTAANYLCHPLRSQNVFTSD